MDNNQDQPIKNLTEEEKQAQADRAFELELLEDREFQGTYRNDQIDL
jgi:hypothetical protein